MKSQHLLALLVFSSTMLIGRNGQEENWITEKRKGFNISFTSVDKKNITEYSRLIVNGMISVSVFFKSSYNKEFEVLIHPSRSSFDRSCQKAWNAPDFKSECWMVAGAIATQLDLISPNLWDKEACEHVYAETQKTQQLITHELAHVYHGQSNVSPDFSDVEGIDWFIEGLATYVSGQCDELRLAGVRKAVAENKIPKRLDDFWTGELRYGLSGSVVMFIDSKYGRRKLRELLPLNRKSALLSALNTTEERLLSEWEIYLQQQMD